MTHLTVACKENSTYVQIPIQVLSKMMQEQEIQFNRKDPYVFQKNLIAGKANKGFNWDESILGLEFWRRVIEKRDFDFFFKKFPQDTVIWTGGQVLPVPILEKMVENQVIQKKWSDPLIFLANGKLGGFRWNISPEGADFWNKVLCENDFDLFFSKYPRTSNNFTNIKTTTNEVRRKKADVRKGPTGKGQPISGKRSRTVTAVGHLGYREIAGH